MEKTLGEALRRQRELRGISLDEISREINIQARYLQALEEEDFTQIHGELYVRYYIRSYLHAVGADENDFFNRFEPYLKKVLIGGKAPPKTAFFDNIGYSKYKKSKKIAVLIFSLLVFLGLLIYFIFHPTLSALFPKPSLIGEIEPDRNEKQSLSTMIPDRDFCIDHSPVSVSLQAIERCWVRILRQDETLIEKTMEKGEKVEKGGYQLILQIGNPSGVKIYINGKEYTRLSQKQGLQILELTPASIPDLFPAP